MIVRKNNGAINPINFCFQVSAACTDVFSPGTPAGSIPNSILAFPLLKIVHNT